MPLSQAQAYKELTGATILRAVTVIPSEGRIGFGSLAGGRAPAGFQGQGTGRGRQLLPEEGER